MGMSDINTVDPASHPGRFPSGEKGAGGIKKDAAQAPEPV